MIKRIGKFILLAIPLAAFYGCGSLHVTTFDNFGSYPNWLFGPKGDYYKSVGYRWDYERYALLYVYRPRSDWAMDEVEAPSFNVNDKRLFNFKGGGYTWYELEPGQYDIIVRRGIFGFEGIGDWAIKKYSDFSLNAEAGQVYYLRYSEIDPKTAVITADGTASGDGPLQLVGHNLAEKEMVDTKLIHHGRELLMARERPKKVNESAEIMAAQAVSPSKQDSGSTSDTMNSENVETDAPTNVRAQPKAQEDDWWPF